MYITVLVGTRVGLSWFVQKIMHKTIYLNVRPRLHAHITLFKKN